MEKYIKIALQFYIGYSMVQLYSGYQKYSFYKESIDKLEKINMETKKDLLLREKDRREKLINDPYTPDCLKKANLIVIAEINKKLENNK